MAKKRQELYHKLRSKYRLVVMRDSTFEEVWFMRLSRLNVITVISSSVILISALVIALIVYTPLKEMIPGYPDAEMTRNIRLNAVRLDSLEYHLIMKEQYIQDLALIMQGDEPASYEASGAEAPVNAENIQDYRSKEDSILRLEVEEQQRYNLSLLSTEYVAESLSDLYFFPPVQGMVTSHFNTHLRHYGVDIVATGDLMVKAALDGTVLLADYTVETGYVIQIQHENELISFYKHNRELFKRPGDFVKAGEAIAVVGNSGLLTTGAHLHFELWNKGKPIDPEKYVSFEYK
ncbi:MAG: M23 family metallopeptidase [Bacteroidales bacterium]|nr:M23 family metallopeptidase [Bacteroidales bacterium]